MFSDIESHTERVADLGDAAWVELHTGEAIADRSGDLFGRHVIKAARIANLASGGQILVSETVREIAAGDRALSFGLGTSVRLRGLDGAHVVHEVVWCADG